MCHPLHSLIQVSLINEQTIISNQHLSAATHFIVYLTQEANNITPKIGGLNPFQIIHISHTIHNIPENHFYHYPVKGNFWCNQSILILVQKYNDFKSKDHYIIITVRITYDTTDMQNLTLGQSSTMYIYIYYTCLCFDFSITIPMINEM